MALDGDLLSDNIKAALEAKMEANVGQPYLDAKDDMDAMLDALSHAVGEEVIEHVQPEVSDGSYTPGDPTNWVNPAPETVQDALDRLAAAVKGLLGSKIP